MCIRDRAIVRKCLPNSSSNQAVRLQVGVGYRRAITFCVRPGGFLAVIAVDSNGDLANGRNSEIDYAFVRMMLRKCHVSLVLMILDFAAQVLRTLMDKQAIRGSVVC